MVLRCARRDFIFPRPAVVMGIVNVTPDSFSDGGRFLDAGAAIEQGLRLASEGAEILDVGGESTRPGAAPVSEEEELRRVLPVVKELVARSQVMVSIDTRKPAVARAAIRGGAGIINHVGADFPGEAMWKVVAETGAGYVAMHMRGTPGTMQDAPSYNDVVGEVLTSCASVLKQAVSCGVAPEQVAIDPGIGFGKTVEHNLRLVARLADFQRLGRPVVLGVSRKSFLGHVTSADVRGRLPAGLACTVWAVMQGVAIFRTHDVTETVQALRMIEAVSARIE